MRFLWLLLILRRSGLNVNECNVSLFFVCVCVWSGDVIFGLIC